MITSNEGLGMVWVQRGETPGRQLSAKTAKGKRARAW